MARFVKRGNVWQYEISYKDTDGKYKKLRKSGFSKKSEAIAAAGEIESDLFKGYNATSKDILLSDYFEKWINTYKKDKVSDKTFNIYLYSLKIINEYLEGATVKTLTRSVYQEKLNAYSSKHSTSSTRKINIHIHAALSNLLDEGVIKMDFTKGAVTIGKVKPKDEEDKYLNFEEFSRLIQFVREKINPLYATPFMVYIASLTGMRYSELVGLTWDNVSFDNNYINVKRTWDFKNNSFAPTKNKESIRRIYLDDNTLYEIKKYKLSQEKLFKKYKVNPPHNFVFYNVRDGLVSNSAVNKQIRKLCKVLEINEKLTCHGLRHSHASMLIFEGINILYISKRLGHKSYNVTMSTYAHAIKELQEQENINMKKVLEKLSRSK